MHGGSGFAREHLAAVIHDAIVGALRHRAAAERVHRDEAVAEDRRPHRVPVVLGADPGRALEELVVHPGEVLLLVDARPAESHPIFLERECAAGVVVRHHQKGLRARGRAPVRAEQEALHCSQGFLGRVLVVGVLTDERTRGRVHRGVQRTNGSRDGPLLDDESILQRGRAATVDHAGDAWADLVVMVRCARSEPDAVDLLVGIVGKPDDVAVAGETLAHVARDRHARGARAQENLGGADGAGTEHHDVSGDEQLRRPELFATKAEWVEVHDPAALWRAFETPDRHVREDLRTVVHGVGEIIHQRGILRLVIAAAHAVAAENARLLFDADVVHAVGERDVDVELSHREP